MDPSKDDARLVDAWRDLLDRHARTTSALERSLHEHGLGVSEYEVLERLATGEKDERRMQELAEAVHLSQSALSRVVARLEADGLVVRSMCAEDRRGHLRLPHRRRPRALRRGASRAPRRAGAGAQRRRPQRATASGSQPMIDVPQRSPRTYTGTDSTVKIAPVSRA